MEERKIKVGAVQMRTMPGTSKETKLNHSLDLIERAAKDGCKIVLHGELSTTDYDDLYRYDQKNYLSAETIPGPTTDAVGEISKKYKNYVIMPMFEKKVSGIFFNAAPLIGPEGEVVGNYRKTHLASARVLERLYFRQGERFPVWETEFPPFARFGTIICFDRRHPEPARILATRGAEIMFCPTAVMDYAGGEKQWETVNITRSIDTGLFGVYSNRAGDETEHHYAGKSMIIDPSGEVMEKAGAEEDIIVSAELDLGKVDEARQHHPILREMRNDLYEEYYRKPLFDTP